MKNRAYNDIEALAMKMDSGDSGDTGDFTIANVQFSFDIAQGVDPDIDQLVLFGPFVERDPIEKVVVPPWFMLAFGIDSLQEVIVPKNGAAYLWVDGHNHVFDINVVSGKAEVEEETGPDGLTEGWTIIITGDAEVVFSVELG